MIDFILSNYKIIIFCFVCFVELVLLVISVIKKNKVADPAISNVICNLPTMVNLAEEKFGVGHGAEKLQFVLGFAISLYKRLTGITITLDSKIASRFEDAIEDILSTPKKKGE